MRNILRSLGARQSIGIGLIIIVIAIIVVAKLLPHHADDSTVHLAGPGASTGTGSTTSTDGGVGALDPDDLPTATPSAPVLHSPVPPVTGAGVKKPQTIALAFAKAWVHHDNVPVATWLTSVTTYTTSDLAGQLAETNPANVPAERVTGATTLVGDTATSCGVRVPTDTGTLVLTMQRVQGKWMVDGVDWDAA
jgi:hypothetical protein